MTEIATEDNDHCATCCADLKAQIFCIGCFQVFCSDTCFDIHACEEGDIQ